jgi:hypothetical protein
VNTNTHTTFRADNIFWTAKPAKDRPCGNCPWRASNFDRAGEPPLENDGTFLPSTRADLWTLGYRQDGRCLGSDNLTPGPRDGGGLTEGHWQGCHVRRTETEPEGARLGHVVVNNCTSTLVLQQRELIGRVEGRASENGLTDMGAARVATYMLDRDVEPDEVDGLDVAELLREAHPGLLNLDIAIEILPPISDEERREWGDAMSPERKAA